MADCADSYFRDVTIDFGDGRATFTVDLPTWNAIERQDAEVLQKLKQAYLELGEMCCSKESSSCVTATCTTSTTSATTNTIASTSKEVPKKVPLCWPESASSVLVGLRSERDYRFHQCKAHKPIWEEIAREVPIDCSGEQCSNKWKSLKRTYMETVDHNSKIGNDRKDCKFYNEFNELYGNKPSTKPTFVMDSGTTACTVNESDTSDHEEQAAPLAAPAASQLATASDEVAPKKKAKKLGRKSPTIAWLDKYAEVQRAEANRRHEEKMRRFDRLLDILEKNEA
ncbi:uncharacterized protein LOC119737406 isoform X2 [Patiria miniata]|uniref:Myb/SANT-like DNA-binding domain-containing protein n=1 Tax=Patiria miniata TaxID=46514 RepID=A0A914AV81_PATMI|nr:uncharacterized protein LOC119737406 isoform X2 [Patiria miniata]